MPQVCETLIIGAGVIGSSVAMSLAKLGMTGVRVVDFDLEGTLSSSELNAGGVRATWNQPINIEMSRQTIDYFADIAGEVGYRPCGYLWLHSPETLSPALVARERQVAKGWPVEVLDLAAIKTRAPFLDKLGGVVGALFGPRDGLVNPNLVKNHFRARAKELGVIFDDRVWLEKSAPAPGRTILSGVKFKTALSQEEREAVLSGLTVSEGATSVRYEAKTVINCAGPWADRVAKLLDYESPCYPVRRQICIFDCRDVDLTPYGMIVDTSGVYFHPEATNGLAGFANRDEKKEINYKYDGESFFMEKIWPALYERATAFERLRHLTGWSGQYEVSPDESAIIGKVRDGIFEAHSFSGHGVMHSYSAGLALAELIVQGRYESVEAQVLSGDRFKQGRLVHEGAVI